MKNSSVLFVVVVAVAASWPAAAVARPEPEAPVDCSAGTGCPDVIDGDLHRRPMVTETMLPTKYRCDGAFRCVLKGTTWYGCQPVAAKYVKKMSKTVWCNGFYDLSCCGGYGQRLQQYHNN